MQTCYPSCGDLLRWGVTASALADLKLNISLRRVQKDRHASPVAVFGLQAARVYDIRRSAAYMYAGLSGAQLAMRQLGCGPRMSTRGILSSQQIAIVLWHMAWPLERFRPLGAVIDVLNALRSSVLRPK